MGGQGSGNLKSLAVGQGKPLTENIRLCREADEFKDSVCLSLSVLLVLDAVFSKELSRRNVFENGHVEKGFDHLKGPGQALPTDLIGFHSGNRFAFEFDRSSRRGIDPADDVEERRLPGTIGTNETHDFPLFHDEIDVMERPQSAKAFGNVESLKEAHGFFSALLMRSRRFTGKTIPRGMNLTMRIMMIPRMIIYV